MDKLTRYREIIRRELREYAAWTTGAGVTGEFVEDPARDHFEVLRFGWDGHRRVHGSILHLDIIDGKVWVQYDGTNRPVAEALVEAGVPKDDIVLAEKPAEVRPFTGYAVG
ncbi:MAG: XisI protein [Fimbriiglobus sp.]